jgi:hypothetical protein
MSKQNIAIFAGTSNTIGLGLELEFSKRFQDDFYLKKCKNIPPIEEEKNGYESYTDEDIENHRKYRWPRLVCDYYNLNELNINDPLEKIKIPLLTKVSHSVDLVYALYDKKEDSDIKELLDKTKYIFLEFGYIRWWDDDLHGVETDFNWPSTPNEIDKFLKDKSVSFDKKRKAIDWLNNVNPIELWERSALKIEKMIKDLPNIEFVLLCWGINPDIFNLEITKKIKKNFLEMPYVAQTQVMTYNIGSFLDTHKLTIKDNVKAYKPIYKSKWLYEDYHASSQGHSLIANQIIKKLSNEIRGLHTI